MFSIFFFKLMINYFCMQLIGMACSGGMLFLPPFYLPWWGGSVLGSRMWRALPFWMCKRFCWSYQSEKIQVSTACRFLVNATFVSFLLTLTLTSLIHWFGFGHMDYTMNGHFFLDISLSMLSHVNYCFLLTNEIYRR